MRQLRYAPLLLALLAVAACDGDDGTDPTPTVRYQTTLSPQSEVPPVTSSASGSGSFEVVNDSTISYRINATSITNVTMAHIHQGAAGVNGPVVVWLFPVGGTAPANPAVTPTTTPWVTGQFTRSQIRPIGSAPAISMDSLKRLMTNGNAYLNVHTTQNVGGEMRGQITLTP